LAEFFRVHFLRLDAPPGMWLYGVLKRSRWHNEHAILIISSVTVEGSTPERR